MPYFKITPLNDPATLLTTLQERGLAGNDARIHENSVLFSQHDERLAAGVRAYLGNHADEIANHRTIPVVVRQPTVRDKRARYAFG